MSVTDQILPALPASEAAGEAAMKDWAELLVARARDEGVELTGEGGLLTGLVRQVLQIGLEVEMTEHLGYERHAAEGRGSPNSRNGTTPKTVTTEIGQVELAVPRDRAGTFAPVTAPQAPPPPRGPVGQRDLVVRERAHDRRDSGAPRRDLRHRREPGDDLEDHRRDRGRHDGVAEPAPRRGLPGAGFDAIVVKVRDAQVANRPVYVAIGVDLAGERDVLGPVARARRRRGRQAVGHDADRAAKPRPGRRVDRVLRRAAGPARVDPRHLARRDSPDLRRAHGPQQPPLCVQEALGPDHQSHARDLCTAPTVGAAEARFAEFSADWAHTYPAMIQSWHNSWDEFVPFLAFPAELRRVVYTTNAIESLNARFRRAVRHRGHFTATNRPR